MTVLSLDHVVDRVHAAGPDTLIRSVTVRPGMCGHNSALIGRIGDWTWDAVAGLTGVDVLRAKTAEGRSTYLSFYYYDIIGDGGFHLRTPTFGDRLQVVTRLFDFGPESILALHRIGPESTTPEAGVSGSARGTPELEPAEVFDRRRPGHLYIQNFNRWIARHGGDNEALSSASPIGFDPTGLPKLDPGLSPRRQYGAARSEGAFLRSEKWRPQPRGWSIPYVVSEARDLNGVGLLYFAAYFSIIDVGLAAVWEKLGRSEDSFLERLAVRTQVCFLGNANARTPLQIEIARSVCDDGELFDVGVVDGRTGRRLAVAAIEIAGGWS